MQTHAVWFALESTHAGPPHGEQEPAAGPETVLDVQAVQAALVPGVSPSPAVA